MVSKRRGHIEMTIMPNVTLLDADGKIDRRAVMREAYRELGVMKAYSWGFGRCMRNAWHWANTERRAEMLLILCCPTGTWNGARNRAAKTLDMAAWWGVAADAERLLRAMTAASPAERPKCEVLAFPKGRAREG